MFEILIPRQGKGKFLTRGNKIIIEEVSILFTKDDSKGIQRPHDDALFDSCRMDWVEPARILVDTGSSADVLYLRLTIEWVTIECAFALLTVH